MRSTTPHPAPQSSCGLSVKDFAQHPAIGITPAFSSRQCDVAGTHSVSNSTLIATIRVRIRFRCYRKRRRNVKLRNESSLSGRTHLLSNFAIPPLVELKNTTRGIAERYTLSILSERFAQFHLRLFGEPAHSDALQCRNRVHASFQLRF